MRLIAKRPTQGIREMPISEAISSGIAFLDVPIACIDESLDPQLDGNLKEITIRTMKQGQNCSGRLK